MSVNSKILERLVGGSRSTDKLIAIMASVDESIIDRVESVEELSLTWLETSSGELLPEVKIRNLKLREE